MLLVEIPKTGAFCVMDLLLRGNEEHRYRKGMNMVKKNPKSRAPDLDKYIKKSKRHRYVSYYQGAQLYNMSYALFVKVSKAAEANLPIRKTTLVDLDTVDKYLETQAKFKEKEKADKEEAEAMMREEVEHLQELVECGAKKYIRLDEATKLYSIGLSTARKLAKDSGAVYKIGGTVLIKVETFENYIETMGRKEK